MDEYTDYTQIFSESARPKLKLFLSADIVGSTAYKQRIPKTSIETTSWSYYIRQFYKRVSDGFITNYGRFQIHQDFLEDNERLFGPPPRFWKTVGDEILFWKELTAEDQIWMTLRAWLDTIADVREWLTAMGTGLDIKSTAWVAGFPLRNRAVTNDLITSPQLTLKDDKFKLEDIRSDFGRDSQALDQLKSLIILEGFYRSEGPETSGQSTDSLVDFIGSGIDTGFRLAGNSSTRRMIVNVELAYLMAVSMVGLTGRTLGMSYAAFADASTTPEPIATSEYRAKIGSDKIPYRFDRNECQPAFAGLGLGYLGTTTLKGVVGGKEYPLFALDISRSESLDRHISLMEPEILPVYWEKLRDFCNKYYQERSDFLFPPFIFHEFLKTYFRYTTDGYAMPASVTVPDAANNEQIRQYKKSLKHIHADMGLLRPKAVA